MAMEAGGPFEMTLTHGTDEIRFMDLLIGEVWVAGGQSKMEMVLQGMKDADAEILAVEHPAIRYGWANFAEANLFNNSGLLTCPFRYDDWTH
jgi:hypothetical protein